MTLFNRIIRPVLFSIDAELAHSISIKLLKANLVQPAKIDHAPILHSVVWGKEFRNPVGLAAGFDKNASAISSLYSLGFGFVEVGTVTPKPQSGNPKPRIFRLVKDDAIINRLGFNNDGSELFERRLRETRERGFDAIIGVNIGKNKDTHGAIEDYVSGIKTVAEISDYIVVNISSPNTPGLRDWQKRNSLEALLEAVLEERELASKKPPILIKVAPDLEIGEIKNIAHSVLNLRIDGIIATNTTVERAHTLRSEEKNYEGGLSGRPLLGSSTSVLRSFFQYTGGNVPIIGVGGIFTGEDAYLKIRSGASLVEIYTALIYRGPHVVRDILSEMRLLLERDGFRSVQDAVGIDVAL